MTWLNDLVIHFIYGHIHTWNESMTPTCRRSSPVQLCLIGVASGLVAYIIWCWWHTLFSTANNCPLRHPKSNCNSASRSYLDGHIKTNNDTLVYLWFRFTYPFLSVNGTKRFQTRRTCGGHKSSKYIYCACVFIDAVNKGMKRNLQIPISCKISQHGMIRILTTTDTKFYNIPAMV